MTSQDLEIPFTPRDKAGRSTDILRKKTILFIINALYIIYLIRNFIIYKYIFQIDMHN